LLRPLCPFVRGALQPRTLRNTRSKAPQTPRHLSPPDLVPRTWFQSLRAPYGAHHSRADTRAFAPAGPLARLSPRRLGERFYTQAATRRTGAPGCLTDSETNGSTRDPQLPWGSCCIRKTLWRLPVLYSVRHRHARRSRKFSGAFDPQKTPGTVARTARPFRVTGLSKSHLLGQRSRRFRLTCPTLGQISPSRPLQGFRQHLGCSTGRRRPADDPRRRCFRSP
jgi:hypothetical protein